MISAFPHLRNISAGQTAGHLLSWMLYISYEYLITYHVAQRWPPSSTLLFYACNISLFYIHLRVMNVALGEHRKRYGLLLLLLLAEVLIVLSIKTGLEYILYIKHLPSAHFRETLKRLIFLDFYRSIGFLGLASLYWTVSHLKDSRLQLQATRITVLEAERDKVVLENKLAETHSAFLQQQLNPHLLFNTLNFVYNSVLPCSDQAAEAILLLADLMRYSTDGADADGKVSLSSEIEQLRKLLRISTLRYQQSLNLELNTWGNYENWRILPLTLLTLTENIFKHGQVKSRDRPATVCITVDDQGNFRYQSSNAVKPTPPFTRKPGIGLRNLRTRLNYIYGPHHTLSVQADADSYHLTLDIAL